MNRVKIPIAPIVEMDDVGWDDGRDLRLVGKGSRSGMPRNHALEDYEILNQLAKATGKRVAAALCLGDWDKDNLLRGEVGITHDPYGWDRKSEIDIEKFERFKETLDAGFVDIMIHGLLHGRYTEDGKRINEFEYYDRVLMPDGTRKDVFSEEDFRRRLDLFFKIYNSWGFKQKIRGFVFPCGCPSDFEILKQMARILKEYGIVYWADNFPFPETLRVIEGVACFKWGRAGGALGWETYDFDPIVLGPLYEEGSDQNSCLRGTHWTNFLRFYPKNNVENVERWKRYYDRQSEVFGCVLANNLSEAVNQQFYYEFADMSVDGDVLTLDLSKVMAEKLECHKNEILLCFKKGIKPKVIEGGEISFYEEHWFFNVYKATHTGSVLTIAM